MCYEFYEDVHKAQKQLEEEVTVNKEPQISPFSENLSLIKIEPEIKIEYDPEEYSLEPKSKPVNQKKVRKDESLSEKDSQRISSDELNKFYKFSCSDCKVNLETYFMFQTHMKDVHKNENPSIICKCDTVIPCIRLKLLEHYLIHIRPQDLQCRECGKQYWNKQAKVKHEKTHNRCIPCPECDKMFFSQQILQMHIKNRHTADDLRDLYECHICQLRVTTKRSVLYHLITKHKMETDHPISKSIELLCPHCAKSFTNKSTYECHILVKHNITMVTCNECGKQMNRKVLAAHIRQMHDTTPQNCPICHKQYRNMHTMKAHKKGVHVEPKHVCDVCGKKFKSKDKLRDHHRGHFIQNRFQCDLCNVANNDYANILKHRKQVHPSAIPIPYGMGRKILENGYQDTGK